MRLEFTYTENSQNETKCENVVKAHMIIDLQRWGSRDDGRHKHRDENDDSASKLLGEESSEQIRKNISIEICTKQKSLISFIPIELLSHCDHVDREIHSQHVRAKARNEDQHTNA